MMKNVLVSVTIAEMFTSKKLFLHVHFRHFKRNTICLDLLLSVQFHFVTIFILHECILPQHEQNIPDWLTL
jgi:hypothetical protein